MAEALRLLAALSPCILVFWVQGMWLLHYVAAEYLSVVSSL